MTLFNFKMSRATPPLFGPSLRKTQRIWGYRFPLLLQLLDVACQLCGDLRGHVLRDHLVLPGVIIGLVQGGKESLAGRIPTNTTQQSFSNKATSVLALLDAGEGVINIRQICTGLPKDPGDSLHVRAFSSKWLRINYNRNSLHSVKPNRSTQGGVRLR